MDTFFQAESAIFAVAVSGFLLIRLERELKALTEAINQLKMCQVCKHKLEVKQ